MGRTADNEGRLADFCFSFLGQDVTSQTPQWGAADAEIKVPSCENTELKRSAFKAWCRSVYSHTCYAYCQGFLPVQSPAFFLKPLQISPVLAVANT